MSDDRRRRRRSRSRPCRNFTSAAPTCRHGSNCRYRHVLDEERQPCVWKVSTGVCPREAQGKRCSYSHDIDVQPNRSSDSGEPFCQTERSSNPNASFQQNREVDILKCVVCLDRNKEMMCEPCKHFCLCEECAKTYESTSDKCPMCRCWIHAVVRVYM